MTTTTTTTTPATSTSSLRRRNSGALESRKMPWPSVPVEPIPQRTSGFMPWVDREAAILVFLLSLFISVRTATAMRPFHRISQRFGPSRRLSSVNHETTTEKRPPIDISVASSVFRDCFSVAPMMEYTDRYQRKFHRLLSKKTVLYTEMVTANALHNAPNPERFLEADLADEEPVVLQLGGSDPRLLRVAAHKAISYGYKDINLNVGCPSERVSDKGCFGAVLMLQPELVAECCLRMEEVMDRKPTVKCRIGVDDRDSYEDLVNFVSTVERIAGTTHFIVHARKAVLGGKFSPAENRSIPPLRYEVVYRLKREFPHLKISLNGGVLSMEEARAHLTDGKVDGVMVGRAAVGQPFEWRTVDTQLYGEAQDPSLSRRTLLQRYGEFLDVEYRRAGDAREQLRLLRFGLKPVLNLFHGEANSRLYRQQLTNDLTQLKNSPPSPSAILARACSVFRDEALDAV